MGRDRADNSKSKEEASDSIDRLKGMRASAGIQSLVASVPTMVARLAATRPAARTLRRRIDTNFMLSPSLSWGER